MTNLKDYISNIRNKKYKDINLINIHNNKISVIFQNIIIYK